MKILITRIIITIVISIASVVGYLAWYSAVSNKSADVVGLQNQITTKTETIGRIVSARAALSSIADDENIVRSYFVSEEKVVSLIGSLEARGEEQGTKINVLSVSTKTIDDRQFLLLSLSVTGVFDSVLRTVGIIEYAPYNLYISDLSIGKDDKNVWRADLKILVGSTQSAADDSVKKKMP